MKHTTNVVRMLLLLLTVSAALHAAEVTGFTLIDARTDRPLKPLKDGAAVDRAELGPVSIRADVKGRVGSVRFLVNGGTIRTESQAPYALSGDSEGNYNAWTAGPGTYTLKAVPYPKSGAQGKAGKPYEITITVRGKAAASETGRAPRRKPVALKQSPPAETMDPGTIVVSGEMKKWHKVTLACAGPASSETSVPNPFTDYRLLVTFTNGRTTLMAPGYYAADGNAAETSATSGNVWLAHFAPGKTGRWTWTVSFRTGRNIAVSDDPDAGKPVASLDGESDGFTIAPTDKKGRDFRGRGLLRYVGHRYLKFTETGEWFLKCGADAPENFLACQDFDNTTNRGGRCKSWSAHIRDWNEGDPVWRKNRGKGIIGALNYLASEGLNAFSFIPMTIHGDDKNVFPYLTPEGPYTRFDCSKLAQWEIVFEHADRLGLYLHFKTLETENELVHDGGDLGLERRMYYRELIARFSHHLALNWNLGEEINNATTKQKKAWADYFWTHDPYCHHIVIHNGANHYDLLGSRTALTGFSLQTNRPDFGNVHRQTLNYINRSQKAGKPWVVACDEPGDATHALRPDSDAGNSHEDGRRNGLWGNVMAGGAGLEWYFGYKHAHSDLTCEDWRSRDAWWDYCRYMLQFFKQNQVPFWDMQNADALISSKDDYCFCKPGAVYVVYLKHGGAADLDLTNVKGSFSVRWYDPRSGGALSKGSVVQIPGGAKRTLGLPPDSVKGDWVILVRCE